MSYKNILVTGGAGFIGSHLVRKLLEQGKKVICLDNLYTGKKENIQDLLSNKDFELVEHNIIDSLDFKVKIDQIYNLACPASPRHYQKDPLFTIRTSIWGLWNMLELAREHQAVLLQASTSEVYGDPLEHPQKETYWGNVNPIGLRANYDEAKRCSETLVMDYNRKYGTAFKIVRIFNTYGPNMNSDDGRVISNFVNQALKNQDLTVYGDGSQTRSFCYIDDLIEGLFLMMEKENFTGPVNLGNSQEVTIKDLARTILDLIPESKSRIIFESLPQNDPKKRCPALGLAKEKLNWEPKTELKEGLVRTVNYFQNKKI